MRRKWPGSFACCAIAFSVGGNRECTSRKARKYPRGQPPDWEVDVRASRRVIREVGKIAS